MTNILTNNNLLNFRNNSEFYRYMQSATSKAAENKEEQLLTLIAKNDLVHQLANYLDNGLSINFRFAQGNMLIHTMAQYDAIDCVKLLIEKGADMDAVSTYGSTPLENAYFGKAESVIDYLLSLGAKASLTSLSELIEDSNIPFTDKEVLQKAISYNDEITDIIMNTAAFCEECVLSEMNHEELSDMFYLGMDLILTDHLNKIEKLEEKRQSMNYGIVNNALMKYDLTKQQAIIFRGFYLNQTLLETLKDTLTSLLEEKSTEVCCTAGQYLNKLLW